METLLHFPQLLERFRRLPWVLLGVTLGVLAGAILALTWQTRERIRRQIAGRDGEVLQAVALMEYARDVREGLAGPISDPGSQLGLVLKISDLKGVMGIRLFDAAGRFVETFPPDVREGALAERDLTALRSLRPVSHYHAGMKLSRVFYPLPGASPQGDPAVPLLEVNVPLHTGRGSSLAGIAQFLIEGQSIAAEYTRLDRHLGLQALGAFAAGGGLLAAVMSWGFLRLRRAHRLLGERTANLIKANQELALAAKTSALGAVTAHLLHDLKNPLAGLQSFMNLHSSQLAVGDETDWQKAAASTRRMQAMISQVVNVLREEQSGARYEVTLAELAGLVSSRVLPLARESGVEFHTALEAEAALPNHAASLTSLILVNLIQNGIQATPRGGAVRLSARRAEGRLVFDVSDQGPGFPPSQTPFLPCQSGKEGGSGIGLALSKQLALHLDAALDLLQNTPSGCVFRLALPGPQPLASSKQAPLAVPG